MEKQYINEFAWTQIFNFLKTVREIYLGREKTCKRFVEAVFWMASNGAQWRKLPEQYGKWNSIFSRFNAWSNKNIWNRLLEYYSQSADLEYVMIDATIVRAHACAAGYGKKNEQALGRSMGGFSTKIHAKVDALGNLLKFIITSGQRNDATQANQLLSNVENSYVIADRAYSSHKLREDLESENCTQVIQYKSDAVKKYKYDKHICKERHAIECFFSKMKHFRRVFSRFDKSALNFTSFLAFVGTCLWLR